MAKTANDLAPRVKIIAIGDRLAGKTCLIKRFCEPKRFSAEHVPTIGELSTGAWKEAKHPNAHFVPFRESGVDYGVKKTSTRMSDGKVLDIKIDFFDLSGDPDYYDVRNEFYKKVDTVLLLFDLGNKKSFCSLGSWLEEAEKFGVSAESSTLVVVGNKLDKHPREVTELQGTNFAVENNATYFETSAKTGACVDDMFEYVLQEMCKRGFYKDG
ncbi:hypothetical protein ACHAWF_006449 [Thalassiosira exigua]